MSQPDRQLRQIAKPFVAEGPPAVAIRDRLKGLTARDEQVLRAVGAHLGSLASADVKSRCSDGRTHDGRAWAARKRELTAQSSSRWAGSITRASNDQWALARRCQQRHIESLQSATRMIRHRLSQPLRSKGTRRLPGGYRSRKEWHAKARRSGMLERRLERLRAEFASGAVHVVRGGRRLLNTRHHLQPAGLTEVTWRALWEAERWHLAADGETGKHLGNETIRVTPDGEVSLRLPAPLAYLANAPRARYVLNARVAFAHRRVEWADRITLRRAVAYRIHLDVARNRWYLTASWQRSPLPDIPLETALAEGVIGVDLNADHLAAYHLDAKGNPVGGPRRFFYDLSGRAPHRDAQVRHALARLLHWARQRGVRAIAVEDLRFAAAKTREAYGHNRRLRQVISGIPTSKLRARLTAMATAYGLAIVAVDPAYTSRWGDEHWRRPLSTGRRTLTRHDAAAVAIGRRAMGLTIRRRAAPPHAHQSDEHGPRTVQAASSAPKREEPRHLVTDRAPEARPPGDDCTRETRASTTVRDARGDQASSRDISP
ncbi:IS200/IS605 family accessory protein TnpB-related protein [Nonomuraea sp. NPDC050663]|uniref:IS200/IS605 family accessory protein TnpB-related protein n=1 Tax=Nonomuraea sp. NPDC050663 TaxID=3364370 RepID=UPI0037A65C85